jgi:broad specificity phosphatase PhoE
MRFCLVRHGQTDWNLEGRYQGQGDVPLNTNGRLQAKALACQLQSVPFAAIYTSDLWRAKETAEIIAKVLRLAVALEPRLREIHQGDWEGQLVEVIKARYAKLWKKRTIDPSSVRPPGGETVGEVAERVHAALRDIAFLHSGDSVLVVSHGLSLATVICRVHGIPVGRAYGVIPDNARLIWVGWEE